MVTKNKNNEFKLLKRSVIDSMNKVRPYDNYKSESDNSLVKVIPTNIYCLGGYWIEKFQPGTFESIFYEVIEEVVEKIYADLKDDIKDNVKNLINDLNKGYKSIQKEFNSIFE